MNEINKRTSFFYVLVVSVITLIQITTATGQNRNNELTPKSLKVNGLNNEETLLKLYVGNFSDVDFKGDDPMYYLLFISYLDSYGNICHAYLPPDKVEITMQECAAERVTRNGFGLIINRTCTQYRTKGTGLFVAPKMHAAKLKLEHGLTDDILRMAGIGMSRQDNPATGIMQGIDMLKYRQSIQREMDYLVQSHSCKSPELQHFQENLRLYAIDQEPIRIDYDKSLFAGPKPPSVTKSQNFTKLIEDLVFEESKSWMVNRFVRGSISSVNISSTDQNGYPSRIKAEYQFQGFGRKEHRGSVTLTFNSGIPECLFFFDFPDRCRTPNRNLIAAYSQGKYQR